MKFTMALSGNILM